MIDILIQLIESMKLPKDTPYNLVGITLGIHGVTSGNQVSFAPYNNITSSNLANGLKQHFNAPVYLENEANLSVIGEKTFQYDYPNIANISVHSGIGLGIIINHQLYTGSSKRAGEFGHTIIEVDGRPCPCGNNGCFEQYASESSLLQEYATIKALPDISFEQFRSSYEAKDPVALKIMDSFIKYMSVGVNNIISTYNPDIVIINSSFTNYFPHIAERIEASLTCKMNSSTRIVPSVLQDTSILLGGICLAIRGFLGVDHLKLNPISLRT
jgi:predicted NBD/HSP70 family sugar kinase